MKQRSKASKQTPEQFLLNLNKTYARLHRAYENCFWISYMGDHSIDKKMSEAEHARNMFRSNPKLAAAVGAHLAGPKKLSFKIRDKLLLWKKFFGLYIMSPEALAIKKQISEIEATILKKRSMRKEGYADPATESFVEASENKMRMLVRTHADEAIRKAAFDALQKLPLDCLDEYIEVVGLRNKCAQLMGHEDFYAYKAALDEGMSKRELFGIFEKIYDRTKYAFDDIRKLENTMPGVRKPWNFGYMMAGDFTRDEDPYFQFEDALGNWGRSFAALGVQFQKGTITLDLLDRKGKWNNGFCHYPEVVWYEGRRRHIGTANFTCNAVPGQIGSGIQGLETLFHEGGHAAHHLNSEESEACINHEYPPCTVSWSETQSMFMDTISSSTEWKTRYAKNAAGESYPFELYEKRVRKLHINRPLAMMPICSVVFFEKEIYEHKNLTRESVIEIARKIDLMCNDRSESSLYLLNVPHIYAWESSAYYHGYGLADLIVHQWRAYFYKKFGYIVDNPKIGKEMQKVWAKVARYSAKEFVKMATGKPMSPNAFISDATMSLDKLLATVRAKMKRMKDVPISKKPVNLNANIRMVHGKQIIAQCKAGEKGGFEKMEAKYRKWVSGMKKAA